LISAPAINLSGTGSFESPPVPLLTAGEFDSIPAGSPATGSDPTDPKVFYVNSFPATAIEYGIEKFAPQVFEGKPDFVVTGVNIGSTYNVCRSRLRLMTHEMFIDNLGLKTLVSGTV
jgi:broad specificity polyphosphatase/5'/3'-nucleotidase SurE